MTTFATQTEPSDDSSPYHAGEKAIQTRAHVRERAEELGRHMIRDFMPDQHRAFFEQLPYVFLSVLDQQGWPTAVAVSGSPGFVRSPDAHTLEIGFDRRGLPSGVGLKLGDPVGVLGIAFHSRRRNRANGRIINVDERGFAIAVDQSFGNCPQYIQARSVEVRSVGQPPPIPVWVRLSGLPDDAAEILKQADTCLLATASSHAGSNERREGCDCSHRGGRQGFIRVERVGDEAVLTLPDFAGNRSFNTLGNLAVNPRIGILVPEFTTGRALHVRGSAEVIWDEAKVSEFYGAERLVRVTVKDVQFGQHALPFDWSAPEWSKQVERTGSWLQSGQI